MTLVNVALLQFLGVLMLKGAKSQPFVPYLVDLWLSVVAGAFSFFFFFF